MLTLDETRQLCREWNAVHTDDAHTPYETVEEAVLSFTRWQHAIAHYYPPAITSDLLGLHLDFCRRVPDELLLSIFECEELIP